MNDKQLKKELKRLKDNNDYLYTSINITAKVYKDYWNCKSVQEARIIALMLRGVE